MNTTEQALKERIKELTCLYEVSSILTNTNASALSETIQAIAFSLKKGFQYPEKTIINIETPFSSFKTDEVFKDSSIVSEILIFNKAKGFVKASLIDETLDFLIEEKSLIDNVALKIGNLLERIEIQENETSLKRQMERADRLGILGEITAGIAHELNTPLANILGFTELLQEQLKDNKTVTEDLEKIIKNAIFSREVVKKLMFFACEMPQEFKQVNVTTSIKNALSLLDASFKKAHVKYTLEVAKEDLFLKADPIQLTQIIFNLIINAIYFSPTNGTVTIKAYQNAGNVYIKISDEGEGLTPTTEDKIFEPFFTTKPTGDGSGLGLSVVHGIVLGHGGTITAKNNKNKGATFSVKLPVK